MAQDRSLCYEPEPFGLLSARQAVSDDFARRGLPVPAESNRTDRQHERGVFFVVQAAVRPWRCRARATAELSAGRAPDRSRRRVPRALPPRVSRPMGARPAGPAREGGRGTDARDHHDQPQQSDRFGGDRRASSTRWQSIARDHDLALISDEVFADYPISGTQPASALRQQTALTFALGGLSKSVGLPQVKLGWIAVGGPAALVADALERLETICDAYLSVSTPVQVAAPDLLSAGAAVRTQIQERVREKLGTADGARVCESCVLRAAGRSRMVRRRAGAGDRIRGYDRARPARTDRRARASRLLLRFRARGVSRHQPASRARGVCVVRRRRSSARSGARR